MSKKAGKQGSEQESKQAREQARKQASKEGREQASKQGSKQARKEGREQASKQASKPSKQASSSRFYRCILPDPLGGIPFLFFLGVLVVRFVAALVLWSFGPLILW